MLIWSFDCHMILYIPRVIGSKANVLASDGNPESAEANDLVSWCIAAFAIPYPIIPGVPPSAGCAPGRTKHPSSNYLALVRRYCSLIFIQKIICRVVSRLYNIPPSLRCLLANLAEIVELQTLCFHIKSEFLIKSSELAEPPAQPPEKWWYIVIRNRID